MFADSKITGLHHNYSHAGSADSLTIPTRFPEGPKSLYENRKNVSDPFTLCKDSLARDDVSSTDKKGDRPEINAFGIYCGSISLVYFLLFIMGSGGISMHEP